MKVIKINTPDGQYTLPLKKVAEHRADYYVVERRGHSKESDNYKEEVEWVMNDDFEGIDWLINNTNYEDWEDDTTKINSDVKVLLEDFWCSSEDFEIVDIEAMKEILVLDIETSGFLNKGGSIVEIGIVSLDLESGDIKEVFNSLVKEPILDEKHQQAPFGWIFKNSDLKFSDLENAPTANEVFPKVQKIIDSYPNGITAYNKKFDFDFLKDRGLTISKELDCPMHLSTNVCEIPGKFGNIKWPNVEEAYKFFFPNEKYVEEHRGLDDAKHEAKIIHELYKRGVFEFKKQIEEVE